MTTSRPSETGINCIASGVREFGEEKFQTGTRNVGPCDADGNLIEFREEETLLL